MTNMDQMSDAEIHDELLSFLIDYQGWAEGEAREFIHDMSRSEMLAFLRGD